MRIKSKESKLISVLLVAVMIVTTVSVSFAETEQISDVTTPAAQEVALIRHRMFRHRMFRHRVLKNQVRMPQIAQRLQIAMLLPLKEKLKRM